MLTILTILTLQLLIGHYTNCTHRTQQTTIYAIQRMCRAADGRPAHFLCHGGSILFGSVTLQLVLEVVELAKEFGERLFLGIFLQSVVEKPDAENELLGVLCRNGLFLLGQLGQSGEVMMAAEIEVHDFLNFTVDYFRDVEVVRTFLFVAVTIHNIFDIS